MLEKTLPLLLIFLLGIFLKRIRVIQKEDARVISKLLVSAVVPASVVSAFSNATIQPKLLLLPLAGVVVVVLLLGISFLLVPLLGLRDATRASFLISMPTLEIGTIGYAVMSAAFGSPGLILLALFDLGNGIFFFTIVGLLAAILGRSTERFQLSSAIGHLTKNPILWAYGVGLLLNVFHIHLAVLSNLLTVLSQGLLMLVMFLIALEFEPSWSILSLPALSIYLKTAIGITLGCVVSLLFGFTGVERIAVVLGSSMPVSLLTVVYAKEYDLDAQYLASVLSLALPAAIIVAPLLTSAPH